MEWKHQQVDQTKDETNCCRGHTRHRGTNTLLIAEPIHKQRCNCRPHASQKLVVPRNGDRVPENVRDQPVADRARRSEYYTVDDRDLCLAPVGKHSIHLCILPPRGPQAALNAGAATEAYSASKHACG